MLEMAAGTASCAALPGSAHIDGSDVGADQRLCECDSPARTASCQGGAQLLKTTDHRWLWSSAI
jgi:hypothetical protein